MDIEVRSKDDAGVPYHGQSLLADDSFLRVLPAIVDNKARLSLDALVMISDILTDAFNRLRSNAMASGLNGDEIRNAEIAVAIGSCWTIVDQLHCARQIVLALSDRKSEFGPITSAFLMQGEIALNLRNAMDHLKDNLGNHASKKGARSPLFGSLSYFHAANVPDHSGSGITLFAGSQVGELRVPLVNPIERPFVLPVGLFEFTAFEITIQLESALGAFRAYMAALSEDIEHQVRAAAIKHANENNVEVESLLVSGRGAMRFETHFGPSPEDI